LLVTRVACSAEVVAVVAVVVVVVVVAVVVARYTLSLSPDLVRARAGF